MRMMARAILMRVPLGLFLLVMGYGAVGDLLRADHIMAQLRHLGYPDYFATLLGVGKALGIAALVLPVPRTLREWAYAGFAIDLTSALVSHLACGDRPAELFPAALAAALLATTYVIAPRRSPGGTALPDPTPAPRNPP